MAGKCIKCGGSGVVYDSKKNQGVACPSCGGTGKAKNTVKHRLLSEYQYLRDEY